VLSDDEPDLNDGPSLSDEEVGEPDRHRDVDAGLLHDRRYADARCKSRPAEETCKLPRGLMRALPPILKSSCKVYATRLKRSVGKHEEECARHKKEFAATAKFWNSKKLKIGERIDPELETKRKAKRSWAHPSAWSAEGTVSLAFESIGGGGLGVRQQRRTRRQLDAMAIVSVAASDFDEDAIKGKFSMLHSAPDQTLWVLSSKDHDCTPFTLKFGRLQEIYAPVARYWRRVGDAAVPLHERPWRLLSADELVAGTACKGLPSRGVLELMMQTCRFAWPEQLGDNVIVHQVHTCCPPVYLQSNKASTLFRGSERVRVSKRVCEWI